MNPILEVAIGVARVVAILLPLCYAVAWLWAKAESRDGGPLARIPVPAGDSPYKRAVRAIAAEGGCSCDYSATLAALRRLQFERDDEAAAIAYVIWAAESVRQGETWTAVEEEEAA